MGRPLVVVGASMGGVAAVEAILAALPPDFPCALAVVLHRGSEVGGDALASVLQRHSGLPVFEVEDKDPALPGCVHLAPADYHLLVDGDSFALSTEGRASWARPSIDVLFDSAAAALGPDVIAVVLTGASSDGAEGAARVKAAGGAVLVQDPATAEARAMPAAAIAAARVDRVLALHAIAPALRELTAKAPPPPVRALRL